MKKSESVDIEYRNMKIRIFFKDLTFSFEVIEGEGQLSQDDKMNILKVLING